MVFFLSKKISFPPLDFASKEGLIAVGGDLSCRRLLYAYENGIFPWYSDGEPILWWSPDPRLVLYPKELKISKSLKKIIRKDKFQITSDTAFKQVIIACARTRRSKGTGTWITDEMQNAYCKLYRAGYAHSFEAWFESRLVGGLYGVALGKCFFGESMFTLITDASKTAFVKLVEYLDKHSFSLIDCQISSPHLLRFGAREIPRDRFIRQLDKALEEPTIKGCWRL